MVFVNSMSDLFHDDVDYVFLSKVFAVMALTPHHTYQVLTKRAGRMASVIGHRSMPGQVEIEIFNLTGEDRRIELPLPNVWLGVSVEDQKWANVRIPKLLETPAAVRFLSCEPLLGPVDLSRGPAFCLLPSRRPAIDWLIVGGESGPGARPMHPEWARSLRDQCVEAGVPFFFKQWGEWRPGAFEFLPDGRWFAEEPGTGVRAHERFTWAEGMCDVWRVGKKRAGRELDGRTWDEMPERVV
jgi:protein gp37